ncbi:hypothetical protein CMI37_28520 [Candidatus Pacearchaeota archaeon]|nr:hypothetical protein [Candidatus Pacearchaeota archaeon]|tara:strand:- start:1817 stop:2653 length:837 start_codon:yes stop_codon:yes gene_type:complete
MPLWYETGEGMRKFSLAKKNINTDVYVCGSGPSLKKVNPFDLQVPGVLTVGLNNSYPYIKPDIWFGMDDPHCYSRKIYFEPFMKIMRGGYQNRTCESVKISHCCPNLFYADCVWGDQNEIFKRKDDETIFIWNGSVTGIALHILLWMGAKNIYLLGSDLSTKDGDYHYQRGLSKENREYAQNAHDKTNLFYKWFVSAGHRNGVNLRSCTPDSKINQYMEYVPLNEALKKSQARCLKEGELFFGENIERERKKQGSTNYVPQIYEDGWYKVIQDRLKNL